MGAHVNQELCIGCGLCAGIAADVFELDNDGKARALDTVNEENRGQVQEAIDACPVAAITWTE